MLWSDLRSSLLAGDGVPWVHITLCVARFFRSVSQMTTGKRHLKRRFRTFATQHTSQAGCNTAQSWVATGVRRIATAPFTPVFSVGRVLLGSRIFCVIRRQIVPYFLWNPGHILRLSHQFSLPSDDQMFLSFKTSSKKSPLSVGGSNDETSGVDHVTECRVPGSES